MRFDQLRERQGRDCRHGDVVLMDDLMTLDPYLVESLGDAVLVFDRSMRILYVNRAAERFAGRAREELLGKTLWAVFPESYGTVFHERYEEVLETRSLVEFEAHYAPLDLWFETRAYPTREGFTVLARDVTERKRLRERVRIADQLVSLATMAAGIAHEINNPLAYVVANLHFIEQEFQELRGQLAACPAAHDCGCAAPSIADLASAVRDARSGADLVCNIVSDLRTFSHPGNASRGPVNLSRVLEMATNLAMHEIRHRARLAMHLEPLPSVLGNESQLGQVFVNLLVNAAQAIPPGDIDANEIRIHARPREDKVVVEVADTGVGIAPEHRRVIFSPFFTTKPAGVGTGLGLSICQSILTGIGGEISVRSNADRGTVVEVVVPAATASEQPEHAGLSRTCTTTRRLRPLRHEMNG